MASISPSSATLVPSATQALSSSGVSSPKWYIKSGGGSLSGVSGSSATYNAPGSNTVAVIRSEEEFWLGFYDASGSSSSKNEANLVNGGRTTANARLTAVNDKAVWTLPTGFTATSNNRFRFREAISGNIWEFCGDGSFKFNGSNETTGLSFADEDEIELRIENVSGTNKIRVYKNGTLLYTSTNNPTSIGTSFYLSPELRAGATVTWTHPEVSGSGITNWSYAEATITVADDNTRPSDVTNLTATKIDDTEVAIDSDAATDNAAVAGYITQRRIDNGSWVTLTPTTKAFSDIEDFPTDPGDYTLEYRRKAYDTAGTPNESLNWSNIPSVEISIPIPPIPPTFISPSTLPIAGTGFSYSYQLEIDGGSGSGSFTVSEGNLDSEFLDEETGLITIADVGEEDYVFTVNYLDDNSDEVEKEFTIPVSNMALWDWRVWCYKRPLQINTLQWQRVYEPLQGDDEVAEDKAQKREFVLQVLWQGETMRQDFIDFLYEHRLRKKFLFQTEGSDEYIVCKIVKAPSEAQMLNYGGFEVVIQEV